MEMVMKFLKDPVTMLGIKWYCYKIKDRSIVSQGYMLRKEDIYFQKTIDSIKSHANDLQISIFVSI